jgi:hypothetical protein
MHGLVPRLSGSGFWHRGFEEFLGRLHPIIVMAGLVPAIHTFEPRNERRGCAGQARA